MTNICDRLKLNLDDIEILEPNALVTAHEEVIAVVPEDLRALWSYLVAVNTEHESMHVMRIYADETAIVVPTLKEHEVHYMLHASRDFATRLFGELLVTRLGDGVFSAPLSEEALLSEKKPVSYGLRSGWRIVRYNPVEALQPITPHMLLSDWLAVKALDWMVLIPRKNIFSAYPDHQKIQD